MVSDHTGLLICRGLTRGFSASRNVICAFCSGSKPPVYLRNETARLKRSEAMSLLNAVAGLLRPRSTAPVTGAAGAPGDTDYTSKSANTLEGGSPLGAGGLAHEAPMTAEME